MGNADPLIVMAGEKHKGIDSDIYKFEVNSPTLQLGDEVTWNIGEDSTSANTAVQRYLNVGGNANKLMIRVKNLQCALSELNGVTLTSPIVIFAGAPFTNKFGKPVSSFKLMFETDNVIAEVIAIK